MLDSNLRMYLDLMNQESLIKKQKEALKEQIMAEMEGSTYTNTFAKATISTAQTFKYTNEEGMIEVLKSHGYSNLVQEKVDTKINQIFKDRLNEDLINDLQGLYSQVDVRKLIVSEI